jgi:3-methyladenine DNA glycosylase AlkD
VAASTGKISLKAARAALHGHADAVKAVTYRTFMKASQSDVFLGVTTGLRRAVAKAHVTLPLSDLGKLMRSTIHDERTLALDILVMKFRKADERAQKQVFDFFLKHRKFIRDWDEVDGSVPYIVGPYLMTRSKALLYRLIRSRNIWDRRIALVATWPMIRAGLVQDTLKLAAQVLDDEHDLIHKATGWMLREVGKKDMAALKKFLRAHYDRMPRTALRYAIERFPKTERLRWLKGRQW